MIYFDTPHAILVHDEIIYKSGGAHGILNIGLLESVLRHIQNDDYYPSIEHKITHIVYSINKNHAFKDGNKRSSIALAAYFMEINGLVYCINRFLEEMENIAVDVADNRIDKQILQEIVEAIIYKGEYSEELKLKLIWAKQRQ